MYINDREIACWKRPYIVAELSGEHKQEWQNMVTLMGQAKEAGADAVKVQLYDPIKLSEKRGGRDKILESGPWKGLKNNDLYQQTYTPREWFPKIFDTAKDIGIVCFASVFHSEDVPFLESLRCPAYKVAASDYDNFNLVRAIADTGKPLIISLPVNNRMSMTEDYVLKFMLNIATLQDIIDKSNTIVLHCNPEYPVAYEDMYLSAIKAYIDAVPKLPMGLSDHSKGIIAPVVATAYGACMIEKHLTLDYYSGGWDKEFSLNLQYFKQMVNDVKEAHRSLHKEFAAD